MRRGQKTFGGGRNQSCNRSLRCRVWRGMASELFLDVAKNHLLWHTVASQWASPWRSMQCWGTDASTKAYPLEGRAGWCWKHWKGNRTWLSQCFTASPGAKGLPTDVWLVCELLLQESSYSSRVLRCRRTSLSKVFMQVPQIYSCGCWDILSLALEQCRSLIYIGHLFLHLHCAFLVFRPLKVLYTTCHSPYSPCQIKEVLEGCDWFLTEKERSKAVMLLSSSVK